MTDSMLDKIRALLAKAEATNFPEEAKAFTEKAQELMTKYAISEATLDASRPAQQRGQVTTHHFIVENPYAQAKITLLDVVAKNNHCQVYMTKMRGKKPADPIPATVVGYQADIDLVMMLWTSLLIQCNREMAITPRPDTIRNTSQVRTWKKWFLMGYASGIGARLRKAEQAVSASNSTALVLANRDQEVERYLADNVRLGTPKRDKGAFNGDGYSGGRSAADRADVGNPRISNQRKALQ